MPEPEKLERDPPETERSETTKSVEGSERVSVRVAVSPELRLLILELMAMVGGVLSIVVSMENVSELLGSEPS